MIIFLHVCVCFFLFVPSNFERNHSLLLWFVEIDDTERNKACLLPVNKCIFECKVFLDSLSRPAYNTQILLFNQIPSLNLTSLRLSSKHQELYLYLSPHMKKGWLQQYIAFQSQFQGLVWIGSGAISAPENSLLL